MCLECIRAPAESWGNITPRNAREDEKRNPLDFGDDDDSEIPTVPYSHKMPDRVDAMTAGTIRNARKLSRWRERMWDARGRGWNNLGLHRDCGKAIED